jgi:hypothetical protein
MRAPPRSLVVGFALLLALGVVLAGAPRAAAAQNGPSWTAGDFWAYTDGGGSSIRVEVVARENVATLLGNVYESFHVRESTTSGSVTITTDAWVRAADLGLVKTSFTAFGITTNTTWDPPQSEASFPLSVGKTWTVQLNLSIKIGNGNPFTVATTYSAEVESEVDVSVPAGTYRSATVNETTAGAYTKFYYSDQVGYWTKREEYNSNDQKTEERVLVEYRYQSGTLTLILLIVGGLVAAAVVIGAIVTVRRRRAMRPPGAHPPPPMEPPQAPP